MFFSMQRIGTPTLIDISKEVACLKKINTGSPAKIVTISDTLLFYLELCFSGYIYGTHMYTMYIYIMIYIYRDKTSPKMMVRETTPRWAYFWFESNNLLDHGLQKSRAVVMLQPAPEDTGPSIVTFEFQHHCCIQTKQTTQQLYIVECLTFGGV